MRHLLLIALLFPQIALAGAWLQPQGKGLAVAQITYFTGDEFFNIDGELEPQSRFSKFELQPYIEYGLTKHITIGGSAFLHRVQQSGDANDGIADPELFARTPVWQNATNIISIQPLIKLPGIYRERGNPRGGSRSFDAEISVLYGRNYPLLDARDYIDTRLGYRVRTRGHAPIWVADVTYGIHVNETWQLLPALRMRHADSASAGNFSENGEQDARLIKAELAIGYRLDDTRTALMTIAEHIAGTSVGAGRSISFGYAEAF